MVKRGTGAAGGIFKGLASHKIASVVIAIAVIGGGYEVYHNASIADAAPQYQIERVSVGNIAETVSGTGQVSAANQIDVTPQVSGTITGIDAKVGEHVSAGDLLATIDSTNALNSLNNAKLALAQLTEAPKATDLDNAENAVSQSYVTAYNDIASTFTDLQTIMPGLNDLLYSQTGFLTDLTATSLSITGQRYRQAAGDSYDKASAEYQSILSEYRSASRTSPTSTIATLLSQTQALAKDVAATVQDSQTAAAWITNAQPKYNPTEASTATSNLSSWSGSINGDVASLASADNGIATAENSLTNLVNGADPLQVQSDQLAVAQAQKSYDNYFIRAPFAGTVGRVPANVYDQASASTIIATIVGDRKVADISLDEVDAAKVSVGNPVSITFNAINGFTATGTVIEKDLVGTVTSGVVSYDVKIGIDTQDPRILPGMSVNVSITTDSASGVLTVPSSAIKTLGNRSYVQIFTASDMSSIFAAMNAGKAGSLGRASSTAALGSSTAARFTPYGQAGQSGSAGSYAGAQFNRTLTIATDIKPTDQTVTTGLSDDTDTEIASGLQAGDWVVLKETTGSSPASASGAPSILNSFRGGGGGPRGGGPGAVRIGG